MVAKSPVLPEPGTLFNFQCNFVFSDSSGDGGGGMPRTELRSLDLCGFLGTRHQL